MSNKEKRKKDTGQIALKTYFCDRDIKRGL